MKSDLIGENRAVFLDSPTGNTIRERRQARRTCARHALTASQPHQILAELLNQLGLRPVDGETR